MGYKKWELDVNYTSKQIHNRLHKKKKSNFNITTFIYRIIPSFTNDDP